MHEPMLALKGRRSEDIIMLQKQSQAITVEFKTQDFCKRKLL